jgi:hypothetical protein
MSAQEQSSREEIAIKITDEYVAPFLTCIPFAGFSVIAFKAMTGHLPISWRHKRSNATGGSCPKGQK